jgi:hypothetical protein
VTSRYVTAIVIVIPLCERKAKFTGRCIIGLKVGIIKLIIHLSRYHIIKASVSIDNYACYEKFLGGLGDILLALHKLSLTPALIFSRPV